MQDFVLRGFIRGSAIPGAGMGRSPRFRVPVLTGGGSGCYLTPRPPLHLMKRGRRRRRGGEAKTNFPASPARVLPMSSYTRYPSLRSIHPRERGRNVRLAAFPKDGGEVKGRRIRGPCTHRTVSWFRRRAMRSDAAHHCRPAPDLPPPRGPPPHGPVPASDSGSFSIRLAGFEGLLPIASKARRQPSRM